MSDTSDQDSKTEDPSEKRIRDALEKGQTPFSREVTIAASLLAIASILAFLGHSTTLTITQSLQHFFEESSTIPLENQGDVTNLLWFAFGDAGMALGGVVAILMVVGLLSAMMQNAPRLVVDRIEPDFSRVSLAKGLGRLFSSQGLVELFKGFCKILAVCLSGYIALSGSITPLSGALLLDPEAVPELMRSLVMRLTFVIGSIMAVVAAADYFWTLRRWTRNLRMTKQEVKDEHKQTEGDQTLKARFRSIARARLRRRMMANVPKATLVVANPTHYAVALRYVRHEGGSPKVMAKGKDLMALKIRSIAEENNIPVVEDKRLARSLYESVEVDRFIPPEFYKAVAEIIIYLGSRSRTRSHSNPISR